MGEPSQPAMGGKPLGLLGGVAGDPRPGQSKPGGLCQARLTAGSGDSLPPIREGIRPPSRSIESVQPDTLAREASNGGQHSGPSQPAGLSHGRERDAGTPGGEPPKE